MDKNFLIGNKAKDLLKYTLIVTKPIGERMVGLEEYAQTLRAIANLTPEEYSKTCIDAADKAERMRKKQGFPKSAVHTYIKEMRQCAANILRDVWAANDVNFQLEPERRIEYIHRVINECGLLLRLVDISYELKYINMKRMEYWTVKITDVKYMAQSWLKKEVERLKEIKVREKEKEYYMLAEIFAQAIKDNL